jgi:N6-adenosine-specific RNA methylase IME4
VPRGDIDSDKVLVTSLKLHGQLAPILRRGGQIVDGRRRMNALTALGKDPWVIDLPADAEALTQPQLLGGNFFELNACRRELSLGVRAAIADTLASMKKGSNQHSESSGMSREDAARAAGVSADTLDRYRKIKAVEDVHAKVLAGTMSLPQAVRTVECRAVAAKAKEAVSAEGDAGTHLDQLAAQGVSFNLMLADPPWDYDVKGGDSTHSAAPERHYPTMTVADIKALPVGRIAAKDSVLWLWTPNCYLKRALEVLEAWGFEYVTCAVWVKRSGVPSPGVVRPTHETLLMARKGQGLICGEAAMSSVFVDPNSVSKHSQKPAHFAQELERLYPDSGKLELFSRDPRPGWVALGNQVPQTVDAGPAVNDESYVVEEGTQPSQAEKAKKTRAKPAKERVDKASASKKKVRAS